MAVQVSLMNQRRYRKPYDTSDHMNSEETDQLWIFQSANQRRKRGSRGSGKSQKLENSNSPISEPFSPCSGCTVSLPHQCRLETCERITINVCGQYYEIWASVLERHPETLLGNPRKRIMYYDRQRDEYFFDRHRPTFEAIFNYYKYGGRLRRPETVPDDIFLKELDFFEIETNVIDVYKKEEGYIQEKVILPDNPLQRKIWMLMEFPETSYAAYAIAVTSVAITMLSIILFCVETLPMFVKECKNASPVNYADPFFVLETICTAWFTVEVFVRFFACPSKICYFKDFKNLVDITAVLPYYITVANSLASHSCESSKSSSSLSFLRVIRLVRIFKLTKHSAGLQVLILTFQASLEGLALFLVAMFVCILLFSSSIYFAELGQEGSQINSIPDGFWWALITMCTVGYGDQVPVGVWGKVIGAICAISGVLTLAIPVPIITENFNKFYAHKMGRGRM
ncbi:hypothetical protein CHS0354_030778 [Potamilus streckersoni]|uniref:BTB domain-containing protein n=1 Tax=Potamilus streckersoni TaxID=2493646 RepID=A0AAE0WCB8_9BIVA|nr:hypothetical protein CHS0354_030778 [Potamilus streckersoni]